jgi:hypothetical protein
VSEFICDCLRELSREVKSEKLKEEVGGWRMEKGK